MARMRKSRQNTMTLILAAAIITAMIFAVGCADKTMEINGDAETVINIGEEYVEQGTNIKGAEISCAFSTVYGKVNVGDDYRALPRVRVQGAAGLEAYIAGL